MGGYWPHNTVGTGTVPSEDFFIDIRVYLEGAEFPHHGGSRYPTSDHRGHLDTAQTCSEQ